MDDHNVHHFWGLSPAIDLLDLIEQEPDQPPAQVSLLQVAPYDPRHTIYTISRAQRHAQYQGSDIHLYVYEDEPEVLARHMLLLAIFLDEALLPKDRMLKFLEVFGNSLLRADTHAYLCTKCLEMEQLVTSARAPDTVLGRLFSLSDLKYTDRDGLVDAFMSFRAVKEYDVAKAWDTRCRHWYGDRYDFRKNMVDWDYHMRLAPCGTPGTAEEGSIIHFYHFRYWRNCGIAFETRSAAYTHNNRTLLSTAKGRTKEFQDRNGKDVGRSVTAFGLWCDILCSPYHSFGTLCEEAGFYAKANKEFKRTSVDISEHNVLSALQELRCGTQASSASGDLHRAAAVRGPTSMEDLAAACGGDEAEPEPSGKQLEAIAEDDEELHPEEEASQRMPAPGADTVGDAAADAHDATERAEAEPVGGEMVCAAAGSSETSAGVQDAAEVEAAQQVLLAEEAALNEAAATRLGRVTVHLMCGDFGKQVADKRKLAGLFSAATVGNRHMHLLQAEHGLSKVLSSGAAMAAESLKYMVNVKTEQADQVEAKMTGWAASGGFQPAVKTRPPPFADAHVLFTKDVPQPSEE